MAQIGEIAQPPERATRSPPPAGTDSHQRPLTIRRRWVHGVIFIGGSWLKERISGLIGRPGQAPAHGDEVEVNDERFRAAPLDAAARYREWDTADGRANWAPQLCRGPLPSDMKPLRQARISDSDDSPSHGRKLYYLYVKDRVAYLDHADADQPEGQVLVKESWTPREVDDPVEVEKLTDPFRSPIERPASLEGKTFVPGEQRALFLMVKLSREKAGTDAGWVYGTVSPDGKRVTSAGRVASCMECHEVAGRDRMFGLPEKDPGDG